MNRARSIVSIAVAYAIALMYAASAGGGSLPLFETYGFWSLDRMGYGDQVLTPGIGREWRKTLFRLPQDAKQGEREWYLVKMHYEIAIARNSGPGTIYLWATTNGRAAASIEYKIVRRDGELVVNASDRGMITGSRQRTESKLVWEGEFKNFLQNSGVRSGKNTLSFSYLVLGKARFQQWRVFSDSGIIRSRNGPAQIELTPSISDRDIEVGDRFRIDYTIRNTSRTPVPPGGRISLLVSSKTAVNVAGQSSKAIDRILGLESLSGSFELRARRCGSIPVTLEASGWGGSPSVRLEVHIKSRSSSGNARARNGDCLPARARNNLTLTPPREKPTNAVVKLAPTQRSRAITLAQSDERIRQALYDRPTRVKYVAPWSTKGTTKSVFGADVTLKLNRPTTLEADWGFIEPTVNGGYRQGVPIHYRAERVTELEVYVDFEKNEVVAFSPLDGDAVESTVYRVGVSHRSDSSGDRPVWEVVLLASGSAAAFLFVAWFTRRVVVSRRSG